MKRLALLILLIIVFIAGCKYASIEQEVSLDSYIDCTYHVDTVLWIKYLSVVHYGIEKSIYAYGIKKEDIEAVKVKQHEAIYPIYLKLQEALKNKTCD